jgi:hypothetical protein
MEPTRILLVIARRSFGTSGRARVQARGAVIIRSTRREHGARRSGNGMRKPNVGLAPAIIVWLCSCGGTVTSVRLQPDEPATLHVGDVAAIRAGSDLQIVGSAGTSLVLVKRTRERDAIVYFYRAVTAGNQTFILTPRHPGPDGCVSCLTVHYFIKVVE